MDMVTKIEIEDAVKVHGKVSARVRQVAARIAEIRGEFLLEREEQPSWHMDSFTITTAKPREGMEHLDELGVRTCWSASVGEDEERYRVTRTVQFPVWYLTQDGWEDRELRKARNHKRFIARLHLDAGRKSVSDSADRHQQAVKRLGELSDLAAEPDEVL